MERAKMFCPFCHKQNDDDRAFCAFCGKALPQEDTTQPRTSSPVPESPNPQKASNPKPKISFNAVKAIFTVAFIVVLAIVILQFYYPHVLPWNPVG
jgi:uncharacterized membrane protein YvbJ